VTCSIFACLFKPEKSFAFPDHPVAAKPGCYAPLPIWNPIKVKFYRDTYHRLRLDRLEHKLGNSAPEH
jgi:hypothetical protein